MKTTKVFFIRLVLSTILIVLLLNFKGLTAEVISNSASNNVLLALGEERLSQVEKALVYNRQGLNFWQRGRIQDAISIWQLEKEIYQEQNLKRQEVNTVLKIASAYTTLGQLELANFHLKQILPEAEGESDLKGRIWEQLANVANRNGNLNEAISYYQKSLTYKQSLPTLNNLVSSLKERSFRWQLLAQNSPKREKARYKAKIALDELERQKYLEEALVIAETKANSSVVKTLIEWAKYKPLSQAQLEKGRNILNELPPSRTKVFLAIEWAKIERDRVIWFKKARDTASKLKDKTVLSYPLLELALIYEKREPKRAIAYATEAAVYASSSANNKVLYRSLWTIARYERVAGRNAAAIENYRLAIASLGNYYKQTRSIGAEERLDFANLTEPLYREALQLILEEKNLSQERLFLALEIFNRLQLAQLQQFFGDDCFFVELREKDKTNILLNNNAVSLTSIILENQTHLILQLPDGQLIHRRATIDKNNLIRQATQWHQILETPDNWKFYDKARQMYDLLLRPFESEIDKIDPQSIIFVHDGILRNIPMSALYDGEKFVAQKWASITSTGLDSRYRTVAKSSEARKDEMIAFGLDLQIGDWQPLGGVSQEITEAISIVGGKKVLNDNFTTGAFARELNGNYSIVHLATHAYFGGTAENSFVLAYNSPLYTSSIEKALLPQYNLLVLSACKTALSSDRSALGLAGLGLRNGIDSIGSLWRIQDEEQIELIESFYSGIEKTGVSKAIALQQAQITQIERDAHPSKWAALVLMQN